MVQGGLHSLLGPTEGTWYHWIGTLHPLREGHRCIFENPWSKPITAHYYVGSSPDPSVGTAVSLAWYAFTWGKKCSSAPGPVRWQVVFRSWKIGGVSFVKQRRETCAWVFSMGPGGDNAVLGMQQTVSCDFLLGNCGAPSILTHWKKCPVAMMIGIPIRFAKLVYGRAQWEPYQADHVLSSLLWHPGTAS
jgi:hypothetical protein